MQTIVIGHRNPDMDSVCAAAAYAALKRRLDPKGNYVAARAGELNARIEFVFGKFGVEPPAHVIDVTPQVRDVMTAPPVCVRDDATVAAAIGSIEENQLRGLPVVDAGNRCLGLLSTFKVTRYLFPPRGELEHIRVVRAALGDILRSFDGETLTGTVDDLERDYVLTVAAMTPESFALRLLTAPPERIVVFVGDRDNVQRRAIARGVRAIVLTSNVPVPDEIIALAAAAGVTLLRSRYNSAATLMQARGALRVAGMVESNFTAFAPDTPLEAARARAIDSADSEFPVLDAHGRLVGLLSKGDFLKTVPRQLILVDHNELTQAVRGADKVPIVEVLDHHRLGGFHTDAPIHFWNNPVGSTSTLVAQLYFQHAEPIPAPIAGLLMAGLISDTLNLSSPTATPTDRTVLGRLETLAGVSADTLSGEIFAVGSPLRTLAPEEAITVDCKEFAEDGQRFSVAQIEELGFGPFFDKRPALAAALDEYRGTHRLLFSALLVTDINTQNSLLLVAAEEGFRRVIDYPAAGPDLWRLDGVVSRKKQLLPYLLQRLQEAPRSREN